MYVYPGEEEKTPHALDTSLITPSRCYAFFLALEIRKFVNQARFSRDWKIEVAELSSPVYFSELLLLDRFHEPAGSILRLPFGLGSTTLS